MKNMNSGKLVKSWRKHFGRRVLVNANMGGDDLLIEAIVIEVSPRGRVKFRYNSGSDTWENREEYTLVEVLPEKPVARTPTTIACTQSSSAIQPKTTPLTQPGDVSMDLFFELLPDDWCFLKVEPLNTQGYYAEIWVGEEQTEYHGKGDTPSEALAEAVAAVVGDEVKI